MGYAELIKRSDWACSEAIKYYQRKEYALARFYKNVSEKYKKEAEETYVCINTNWQVHKADLRNALETCIKEWFSMNQKAMCITLETCIKEWFSMNQKAMCITPDLGSKHALYLGNRADTCIEMLKWQYSNNRSLVVDLNDNPEPFSDTIDRIKHLCNINKHNVSIKIVSDNGIWYESTDDLYEWLDNYIQMKDCKNGCQIYKAHDQYYFCISGQHLKEIHVYFKELEEW